MGIKIREIRGGEQPFIPLRSRQYMVRVVVESLQSGRKIESKYVSELSPEDIAELRGKGYTVEEIK